MKNTKKKGFILAEDAGTALENIKSVPFAGEAPASGAAAAKQTGNEFPSFGGVSAKQTGWLKAFTLAEVLISLTIIGVIAAITVPALIQRTNKQEYVTALQKTYSTLSQAANMIIAENGSPKTDENGESWLTDVDSLYNMYKKYLNNARECGNESGCFTQGAIKRLDGESFSSNWDINLNTRNLILADGTQLMFSASASLISKNCESTAYGSNNLCALFFADINGAKKPNQYGRDVFIFVLKENGLYPAGCDDEEKTECVTGGKGWGCACKVLREGAMNY